jgi:hypothetical protein
MAAQLAIAAMMGGYGMLGGVDYGRPVERPYDKETSPETLAKMEANRKLAIEEARAKSEAKRLRRAARLTSPK